MNPDPSEDATPPAELVPPGLRRKVFPIVGIGASAGGIDAFRELLRNVPAATGMGFVYVQHLDPSHESILADIFARDTEMSVVQASDGVRVRPDSLYIIPPNTTMTILAGELRLARRTLPAGQHLPIDEFLRSLAEDQSACGIAVILSGASSDGALGLQAVKQNGGITFAQDDSAKHLTMPHHAIGTGAVDFVLRASEIGLELGRMSRHPYLKDHRPDIPEIFSDGSSSSFAEILELLKQTKHTDFTAYRATTLKRRVARRMSLCRLTRIEDYVTVLKGNSNELEALFNEMLIKVTSFFRDPAVFRMLADSVFPAVLGSRSSSDAVRIWIPACSTGEEAYSMAIAFLEWRAAHAIDASLQIFGTDLSQHAVDRARRGLFVENISMDVPPEHLDRYFHRVADHFQINKAVRDLCVFAKHDVTRDPPFSRMDLISCRNMLIYMSTPLQREVVKRFHYGLRPGGILILGSSESLLGFPDLFSVFDRENRMYRRISSDTEAGPAAASSVFVDPAEPKFPRDLDLAGDSAMIDEADRVSHARSAHSGVVIEPTGRILQFRGDTARYLMPAPGRATLDVMKMAREELRMPLRAALYRAEETGLAVRTEEIHLAAGSGFEGVRLDILPLSLPGTSKYFLVMFENTGESESGPEDGVVTDRREIVRMEQQLAATTEYLQSVIEELKASHEEVLSNNEELQSVNEEIETGKEELQSANEELLTVNEQLHASNSSLNQANADLRSLLTAVAFPIVVLNTNLEIRMFTPAAAEMFNFIASDIGRKLDHIRSNLSIGDLAEFVRTRLDSGAPSQTEVSDRSGNWFFMRISSFRDRDTGLEGVILTLVDIGPRKRADEERERLLGELKREKAQLSRLIEYMPSGLIVADASGTIVVTNQHTEKYVGQGVQGTSVFSLERIALHMDGTEYHAEEWPIVRALRSGETIKDETLEFRTEHGGKMRVRANAVAIRDEARAIVLALMLMDDITDVDTLREQLAHSEKIAQSQRLETIGRLAGGVAHDFNNQLSVIIGFSQFVRDDGSLSAHLKDQIDTVLNAANRAASLTSQLLAFSRKQPIQLRKIDLNSLVGKVAGILRRLVSENIELEVKLFEKPCLVMADAIQMEQVVMNLVTNAQDAIEKQGKITIETDRVTFGEQLAEHSDWSMLTVTDNGRGMTAEVREHIFEPFYTTKEFGRGTGLGLASVFGSVKQHNGEIRVKSSPGSGTRIELMLPCITTDTDRERIERQHAAGGNETILLVEDEPGVRAIARRSLEHLGYKVLEAIHGKDALRVYAEHGGIPDMVLTDVVMPEMHGDELVQNLRRMQPGIKVAFMSGYPQDVIGEYGVVGHDLHFIQKPFNVDALGRLVRQALDN